MPRPLRIEYENAWYHVMNRGSNRQVIFMSDNHRNLFEKILQKAVKQFYIDKKETRLDQSKIDSFVESLNGMVRSD